MSKKSFLQIPNKKQWSINDFIEFSPPNNLFSIKIILRATLSGFPNGVALATVSQVASALKCNWNLSVQELTFLTVAFFIGEGVGSFYLGRASDTCGRKISLMVATGLTVYFGLLAAISPSMIYFMVFRVFVGAGYGANVMMIFIYSTEYIKKTDRSLVTLVYMLIFTTGTLFSILMSYWTLNRYGWRIYMALCSIGGIFGLSLFNLPESMYYYQMHEKADEIKNVLNEIAETNNIEWPSHATLTLQRYKRSKIGLVYTFQKFKFKLLATSVVFIAIMFSFYGLPFFILYKLQHGHCNLLSIGNHSNPLDTNCIPQTDSQVLYSFYITSGTIPGAFVSYILANKFGRKVMMNVTLVLLMLCYLAQTVCLPNIVGYGLLFASSGLTLGASCYIFNYISELFPTNVRASAAGFVIGFGKNACIVTPFIFQQLLQRSPLIVLVGLPCLSLIAIGFLWFLPETLNKDVF